MGEQKGFITGISIENHVSYKIIKKIIFLNNLNKGISSKLSWLLIPAFPSVYEFFKPG